jgi:hypothetical protein
MLQPGRPLAGTQLSLTHTGVKYGDRRIMVEARLTAPAGSRQPLATTATDGQLASRNFARAPQEAVFEMPDTNTGRRPASGRFRAVRQATGPGPAGRAGGLPFRPECRPGRRCEQVSPCPSPGGSRERLGRARRKVGETRRRGSAGVPPAIAPAGVAFRTSASIRTSGRRFRCLCAAPPGHGD